MPLNLVEAVLRRCFSTVRLDGKEGRGEGVPLSNGYLPAPGGRAFHRQGVPQIVLRICRRQIPMKMVSAGENAGTISAATAENGRSNVRGSSYLSPRTP